MISKGATNENEVPSKKGFGRVITSIYEIECRYSLCDLFNIRINVLPYMHTSHPVSIVGHQVHDFSNVGTSFRVVRLGRFLLFRLLLFLAAFFWEESVSV